MNTRRWWRRVPAVVALAAASALAALVVAVWIEHRTAAELPAPTGAWPVGRIVQAWADPGGVDLLAPDPRTPREIVAWIWYPAASGAPGATGDYVPAELRAAIQKATAPTTRFGVVMMRWLTRDATRARSHTTPNAAVSPRRLSYPVLLLRGGASSGVLNYSTIAEDLASHGYVVVGIDAPYRTNVVVFPDGRAVTRTPQNNPELLLERHDIERVRKVFAAWIDDMRFAIDRLTRLNAGEPGDLFTGRLDLSRLGAFGHSFGGAQAAQFCHDEPRCRAAVDIDGAPFGEVVQSGVGKPFMFLLSGHGDFSTNDEVRAFLADVQTIYDRLPADRRARVTIRGANHFTFSDDGAVLKSAVMRGALRLFGRLGIDGRRQLSVTAYAVRTFFDAYLGDRPSGFASIASADYPELVVED